MQQRMRYTDLKVWQRGIDLVISVYELSGALPPDERFGLISQMRRAAVSVPANIAEGHGRLHRGDYVHHLSVANGSLRELETHVVIAGRLCFLAPTDCATLLRATDELGRMLSGLIRRLRSPSPLSPLPS
jgi:four helix bundle protein